MDVITLNISKEQPNSDFIGNFSVFHAYTEIH